jgi:hypothetical protein
MTDLRDEAVGKAKVADAKAVQANADANVAVTAAEYAGPPRPFPAPSVDPVTGQPVPGAPTPYREPVQPLKATQFSPLTAALTQNSSVIGSVAQLLQGIIDHVKVAFHDVTSKTNSEAGNTFVDHLTQAKDELTRATVTNTPAENLLPMTGAKVYK